MRQRRTLLAAGTIVATALLLISMPSVAPGQAVPDSTEASMPGRGMRDRAELEAFIDGVMAAQLEQRHVAGATMAVVKDGSLFFAKGYGYADVAKREPVDPARTLFRIGSVSKLFTWTAVMQLVQEGKLDLDADVNTYLDFEIPATYSTPITLRNLLTHTPGFEEDSRDLIGDDPEAIAPLGQWLATHMPERVRPPGTYSSYSNYGAALAGYIVQRVSGLSWEDYIERHILNPLGMDHTTGRQPLPAQLAPDMSQGYTYRAGRFDPKKFEIIIGAAPAGSMSSTATDIAKFMLAHLNLGALGSQRILSEATAREMHARAFAHDPRLPSMALGFYEQSSHGLRMIGHGGDTQWFHSELTLIPSENIGIFVSYNTSTGGGLSGPFITAILDHYFPAPTPVPAAFPENAREQAQQVAGQYLSDRRSYSTFQKAVGLMGATTVNAQRDGSLLIPSSNGATRFIPVGPLLYREALGHELLAFQADSSGQVTHAFMSDAPFMALERLAWYQSPKLHQFVLGISSLVFLAIIIVGVTRLIRRRFGRPQPANPLPGRWFVAGLAVANLAFVVALVILSSNAEALLLGSATALKIALVLPVIGALLTLCALVMAVLQWKRGAGTRAARVRYDLIVVVALLFMWSLNQWNLLGWRM